MSKIEERQATQARQTTIDEPKNYTDFASLSVYDQAHDTYHGTGGFRDGRYIIPNPIEAGKFYDNRRKTAVYKGYFAPVVNAMIDPVYNKVEKVECTGPYGEQFIEDCDTNGTTWKIKNWDIILDSAIYGINFVVVDNFTNAGDTVAEAKAARAFPYCYSVSPRQYIDHKTDAHGNLTSFTFFAGCSKVGGKNQYTYRMFDKLQAVTWVSDKIETCDTLDKLEPSNVTEHNLGIIPVYAEYSFSKQRNLFKLPEPSMMNLITMNHQLYCIGSEVRAMSQKQTFSMIAGCFGNGGPVTTGTNNYINVPDSAKFMPTILSFDPQHFINLKQYYAETVEEIYKIASQNGVVGVMSAESGIAKEWDFRALESVLRNVTYYAKRLDAWMSKILTAYTGSDHEITVDYPTNYSPSYNKDRLLEVKSLLQETPPEEVRVELWKEAVSAMWANNPDKAKMISDMMDMTIEDASKSGAGDPDNTPPDDSNADDTGAQE